MVVIRQFWDKLMIVDGGVGKVLAGAPLTLWRTWWLGLVGEWGAVLGGDLAGGLGSSGAARPGGGMRIHDRRQESEILAKPMTNRSRESAGTGPCTVRTDEGGGGGGGGGGRKRAMLQTDQGQQMCSGQATDKSTSLLREPVLDLGTASTIEKTNYTNKAHRGAIQEVSVQEMAFSGRSASSQYAQDKCSLHLDSGFQLEWGAALSAS